MQWNITRKMRINTNYHLWRYFIHILGDVTSCTCTGNHSTWISINEGSNADFSSPVCDLSSKYRSKTLHLSWYAANDANTKPNMTRRSRIPFRDDLRRGNANRRSIITVFAANWYQMSNIRRCSSRLCAIGVLLRLWVQVDAFSLVNFDLLPKNIVENGFYSFI